MQDVAKNRFVPLVDIIKCFAIVLVVIGHYSPDNAPKYWEVLRTAIYTFHMPAFFVLSGYLFWFTTHHRANMTLSSLLKIKFMRLIVPFMTIAFLFFCIKYVSQFYFYLQHPVNLQSLLYIFIDPVDSYMPLLWYMYALFIMIIIFYLLLKKINIYIILSIFTICTIVLPGMTNLFAINSIVSNFPFVILGYVLSSTGDIALFSKKYRKYIVVVALVFMALFSVSLGQHAYLLNNILGLLLAVLGVLFLMFLASYCQNCFATSLFVSIGYYSMTIYLFHTLFESFFRIFFYQYLGVGKAYFAGIALISILAGVLFPLLLEKFVIRKVAVLRRLVLGLAR